MCEEDITALSFNLNLLDCGWSSEPALRHYITLAVSSDKLREVLMRFPKLGVGRGASLTPRLESTPPGFHKILVVKRM